MRVLVPYALLVARRHAHAVEDRLVRVRARVRVRVRLRDRVRVRVRVRVEDRLELRWQD